ncbi:MAG TPA: EAL domain-containing protein [Polyangia bacterium]|nr:EAL domain-containing protein [Polyangia bacterium]
MSQPRSTAVDLDTPLRRLIQDRGVAAHFQPIFSARQKAVVGVEALARGVRADGSLVPPHHLFKMAAEEGLSTVVEGLCREAAVETFTRLDARPDELLLFLNLDVNLDLAGPERPESLPEELEGLVARRGVAPTSVAVEFLEARLDDVARFASLAAALRARGFLVVLDDVGAGHSNLDRIPLFQPDIIKIDRSLITGVDADYYKQETLKSLVGLSRRIGALVVAEGIETQGEAIAALELGVDLLQGFYLSRPQPVSSFAGGGLARASGEVELLARKFKSHMVGAINGRKLQHRRFNVILNRILCDLGNTDAAAFDEILGRIIPEYPTVECIYVLDDAGVQVTETVWNGAPLPSQPGSALFRPAPRGTDHSLKEYYYVPLDVELQKYTTDPYVSLASGNLCRTISTCFRDAANDALYVLCVDVRP